MKAWQKQRVARRRFLQRSAVVAITALMGIQWVPMALAQGPEKPDPNWQLKHGLKQALSPKERAHADAIEQRQADAFRADVQRLSASAMASLRGRGVYRNKYFDGTLPWQESIAGVNVCNGNLFQSFTDIQVSPARGAGLALQRTYNSSDDRIGPFGVGWTHAYDIRMEEEGGGSNLADRTDFFGGKHKYHRDADGLYTPPVYLFDQMNSDYQAQLLNGPQSVLADTQTGEDGTTKHFIANGNERDCDWIQDRYGNRTTLTYGQVITLPNGGSKNALTQVTDPSGRSLTFTWANLNTAQQPAWRITQVNGPQYNVVYNYGGDFNLSSVTLDPGASPHLNRTTTYTYTYYSDSGGSESGLLATITDPLGHVMTYQYGLWSLLGTVGVVDATEPAGIDGTGATRTMTWDFAGLNPVYQSSNFTTNIGSQQGGTGFFMQVYVDPQLRELEIDPHADAAVYSKWYDASNNVTEMVDTSDGQGTKTDFFTYGPHGNVLTHTVKGFTGTETTSYYNADKYFQKASFTDMNGHTTNWDYYSITDPSPGNRGNVKLVQDARYGITNKQFTYTYNQYGQKASEVNLNGVETDYTYGDTWGNLTQVVQDPGTGHLNRTTSMSYDIAGDVLQSTDPLGQTDNFTYNNLGQPVTASFPA
ncbi:MAG: DUF6531 domain-containing protein, partial [Chloroflexi bacterium]|nr:DUF6531 domain-containing protein [Chloroflexota bacterium]